jgi:hypothetical protein
MDIKKELVRIALVGTQRSSLSANVRKRLAELGIREEQEETEAILMAAAIWSRMEKASLHATFLTRANAAPDSGQGASACSPKSIKHLYMIVDGAFEQALPEFLHHLAANDKCLPPEILPDLLEQYLTSPDLWERLKQSLGEREKWLIRQNPHWHRLLDTSPATAWDEAGKDERLRIFTKVRKEQPRQALAMLQATWEEEGINQRVRFLNLLATNLGKDDEEFLEDLLDHRRKEIRKAAARLLAQLPDSRLSQRMFTRLTELITSQKRPSQKDKLDIRLPDRLDDHMIRDGIDPRVQWFKGGVKASRLGQMVAMVPPAMWRAHFNNTPKEMIRLFVRSDWGELLLQAAVEATVLHRDMDWAEALLSFRMESSERQRWQGLNVNRLMDDLPDEVFNRVAIKGMRQTEGLLEENSPITYMLKTCACLWEDELTLLVMKNLQDWLAGERSRYWNGWHYRNILKRAAYTCNPFLHDRLANDWPEDSKIWSSWERDIEEFLSTLFFRKKMITALKNDH